MKLVRFQNCIPVKGSNRSIILDLRRQNFKFIPNSLYEILSLHEGKTIQEIKKKYKNNYDKTIDEYIEFLQINEFVFFDENINYFSKMDNAYFSVSDVTNCVLDITNIQINFKKIFNELNDLNCTSISIRFYIKINLDFIFNALSYLKGLSSAILSVEIYFKWDKSISIDAIKQLMFNYPRFTKCILYSANKEEIFDIDFNDSKTIYQTKKNIKNEKSCGFISKDFFKVNSFLYFEANSHNSCLNRKISIDINGDIKNCPSMPESYGNIKDTTLEEAINKPGFKKYWNITKDDIEVCRDCEFRYICTDCRAYTERTKFSDEGLDLSKPLKCGYNPYTNEWSEWSTNPLKEKAIEYYGMKEIIENDKK